MNKYLNAILTLLFSVFVSSSLFAGGTVRTNPPSECSAPNTKCNCPQEGVSANCIKVNIGLGETTPWTGSLGCSLKIFADDDSPSVFTPESLHAVLGGYTFKRLGQKTMADGVTPAEVVLSHPNGRAEDDGRRSDTGGSCPFPPQRRGRPLRLRERRIPRKARPRRPHQDGRAASDGRLGGLGYDARSRLLRPLRRRRDQAQVPRHQHDRCAWGTRLHN